MKSSIENKNWRPQTSEKMQKLPLPMFQCDFVCAVRYYTYSKNLFPVVPHRRRTLLLFLSSSACVKIIPVYVQVFHALRVPIANNFLPPPPLFSIIYYYYAMWMSVYREPSIFIRPRKKEKFRWTAEAGFCKK